MSNGRRFDKGLWVRFAIIAALVLAILIALPTTRAWLNVKENLGDQNKYMFSAVAQVRAALLALVFSITLIATQFVTKYTHRTMPIIFNLKVILYMSCFAGATVVPLICLSNPIGLWTLTSLIVGGLFVFSIPVFFFYLRNKMSIDGIIKELKKEGVKALERNPEKAEECINALDSIAMGAYSDRNFEVFSLAEKNLVQTALGIEQYSRKQGMTDNNGFITLETKEQELHERVFRKLQETCEDEEIIENRRALYLIIETTKENAYVAIDNSEWSTV